MYYKTIILLTVLAISFSNDMTAQSKQTIPRQIILGYSIIHIESVLQDPESTILYLNIHEDEQTSIAVAHDFSTVKPINFVYLSHIQTRRIHFNYRNKIYSIDPNRIFTPKGRRKTIDPKALFKSQPKRYAKSLAEEILNIIASYQTIVTMHNNTDVNYSIKSYLPGGDESGNTAEVHVSDEWDADDFIYTTDLRYFNYLKAKNVNVILQDNQNYINDGSLSVYCGQKGIPYINIEAQKGHYNEQFKLMRLVSDMLSEL